jgi:hypothetical protein
MLVGTSVVTLFHVKRSARLPEACGISTYSDKKLFVNVGTELFGVVKTTPSSDEQLLKLMTAKRNKPMIDIFSFLFLC